MPSSPARKALMHVGLFDAINATARTPDRACTQVISAGNGGSADAAATQDCIPEVAESRLLGGVHCRFSLNAGRAAGIALGTLASQRHFARQR